MIRILLSMIACTALVACGDGRGSQYSSARAIQPAPSYIPITPGASPVVGASATPAVASSAAPTSTVTPVAAPAPRPSSRETRRFARGPIFSACQSSGRKAATRARCGCVQWVANQELTAAQQRRGAGYFSNQHGLQEVRQSSQRVRANGEFWSAWKAYGETAARQCSQT